MFSLFNKIYDFFLGSPLKPIDKNGDVKDIARRYADLYSSVPVEEVIPEEVKPEVKLTEFQKARNKFREKTDILVISEDYADSLTDEENEWLVSLRDKVIYFKNNSLINVAIISAGVGWSYHGSY